MTGRRVRAAVAAALAVAVFSSGSAGAATAPKPLMPRPLHALGNKLVDDAGHTVTLRGVNRSSPETLCMGTGLTSFFYGPTDAASVTAIKSWGSNVVRIPLNEDCWLGRNGFPLSLTAGDYRGQLAAYTRLIEAAGLYVILDVHFAETTGLLGVNASTGAAPMLDAAHGVELWQSLAATFKNDTGVLFDLYNEAHDVNWACWRDGCADPLSGARYAGMRDLVTAVRGTGARNVLVLTGPSWGNDLSSWLAYAPADPLRNLVAAVHIYPESGCVEKTCVDARVLPVAAVVPTIIGEFGTLSCDGSFLEAAAAWADANGIGYVAFTWNTPWGPCPGYHLISSYDGTPTAAGAVLKAHLLAVTAPKPRRVASTTSRFGSTGARGGTRTRTPVGTGT
jgi:endoglucanase